MKAKRVTAIIELDDGSIRYLAVPLGGEEVEVEHTYHDEYHLGGPVKDLRITIKNVNLDDNGKAYEVHSSKPAYYPTPSKSAGITQPIVGESIKDLFS